MSEHPEHPHHRPHPRPCEACGSTNVDVDRQGEVLVFTCKDCGNTWQKELPPHPHHGDE